MDLADLIDAPGRGPADEQDAQHAMTLTSHALESQFADPEARAWEGSPYAWLRHLPAAKKGKTAERLVAGYLAGGGVLVGPARGQGASFTVGGRRVKVRLSLRWASGEFVFQQLDAGDYDQLVLLGVSPERVYAWTPAASQIAGRLDPSTGWLSFKPDTPPEWLAGTGPELLGLADRLSTD